MNGPIYIDGILVDWGATFFNKRTPATKDSRARGKYGDLIPKHDRPSPSIKPVSEKEKSSQATGFGSKITTGDHVRSRLKSITKKAPEVLVKISGIGHGMTKVGAHLEYISRNGQIELEDEKGDIWRDPDEVAGVKDTWQFGGQNRLEDEDGPGRLTYNVVLSMPAGTPALAVKRAARDFAAKQFRGHKYVMALHTEETDPDPKPSPNPHVHICVVAEADDGSRLNPRKADLQEWREGFAAALRENGVEAAATNRQQRMQRDRGKSQARVHMRHRGVDVVPRRSTPLPAIEQARRTHRSIELRYRDVAKALASSHDPADRKLAADITRWSAERGRTGVNRFTVDYQNFDQKRINHARRYAAARIHQPGIGKYRPERAAEPLPGMRDLSSIPVVQELRKVPEVLLRQDAQHSLGVGNGRRADHDVRREGVGAHRPDGGAGSSHGERLRD